jgi:cysteine/O-acetylserine efflux protein
MPIVLEVPMPIPLSALASYVLVTTFTPGPNNVSSTSAGVLLGYRRALPYLLGIFAGFLLDMLLTGYFNLAIETFFAGFMTIVKWIGFTYMLWLIVGLFLPHRKGNESAGSYTFGSGFILQLLNPKVILYGFTIFGMFPSILAASSLHILVSSIALAIIGFASCSTWCLAGSTLTHFLANKKILFGFNVILALLLGYCAYAIVRIV